MEFQTFKIGEIAKVQGGFAFKSADFKDSGVPVLKITNVQDRKIELNNLSHVDPSIVVGLERFFVKSGDVLISMTGNGPQTDTALVGRTARYNGPENTFLLNQRVGRFLINENLVRKRFFYYWISRPEINRELAMRSTGSANQANINATTIENFDISIPDLAYQDKTLEVLGDIDDKIDSNIKINEIFEAIGKTIFKEWFIDFGPVKAKAEDKKYFGMDDETASIFPNSFEDSDLGRIPKGWKPGKLEDIAEVVGGGTPSTAEERYFCEPSTGISWLSPKDLSGYSWKYISCGATDITELGLRNSSARVLPEGTVLFSSRAPIGYVAIAEKELCTNQGFKSLVPKNGSNTEFLYYLVKANVEMIESRASGSTFKEISGNGMKELPVIIPPNQILESFKKIVSDFSKLQKALRHETENLKKTRDLLLPRLLSGELQISEGL